MKIKFLSMVPAVVVTLALAAGVPAQNSVEEFGSGGMVMRKNAPAFSTYREPNVYKGRAAAVKLNSRDSRNYKTVLREGVRENGANFAGHYSLITWGCGTNCNQLAVVDVKTGQSYFTPGMLSVISGLQQTLDMVEFKPDSRLLKVVGRTDGKNFGTFYYEWKNNRFKLVRAFKGQQVK